MPLVSVAKKSLPKFIFSFIKNIYDNTSFWFTLYVLLSPRRMTSLRSCLRRKEPLKIKADNVIYQINAQDNLQRRICMSLYEREDLKRVMDCFKEPHGVFLDIGANIGYFSLNVAKNCPNCKAVYAFEADPHVYEQLNHNVQANHLQGSIKIFNVAVTSKLGMVMFNQSLDTRCSGAGSLHKFSDMNTKQVSITGLTVDAFVATHNIETITCIKVDIEGHEIDFLKGARETLQKGVVKNIFIEFNGQRLSEVGVSFDEFHSYFPQEKFLCTYNNQLFEDFLHKRKNPKEFCENFLFTLRS